MPTFEIIKRTSDDAKTPPRMSASIDGIAVKSDSFIAIGYDHGKDKMTIMTCTDVVTLGIAAIKLLDEFKDASSALDDEQRGALCRILCEEAL